MNGKMNAFEMRQYQLFDSDEEEEDSDEEEDKKQAAVDDTNISAASEESKDSFDGDIQESDRETDQFLRVQESGLDDEANPTKKSNNVQTNAKARSEVDDLLAASLANVGEEEFQDLQLNLTSQSMVSSSKNGEASNVDLTLSIAKNMLGSKGYEALDIEAITKALRSDNKEFSDEQKERLLYLVLSRTKREIPWESVSNDKEVDICIAACKTYYKSVMNHGHDKELLRSVMDKVIEESGLTKMKKKKIDKQTISDMLLEFVTGEPSATDTNVELQFETNLPI